LITRRAGSNDYGEIAFANNDVDPTVTLEEVVASLEKYPWGNVRGIESPGADRRQGASRLCRS
jgi:hypothetical protein